MPEIDMERIFGIFRENDKAELEKLISELRNNRPFLDAESQRVAKILLMIASIQAAKESEEIDEDLILGILRFVAPYVKLRNLVCPIFYEFGIKGGQRIDEIRSKIGLDDPEFNDLAYELGVDKVSEDLLISLFRKEIVKPELFLLYIATNMRESMEEAIGKKYTELQLLAFDIHFGEILDRVAVAADK